MMSSNMYDPSIQNQVAQQQIQALGTQMEKFHSNDPEMLSKIRQANEMNQNNNVQGAASILYTIINRTDKNKEEQENYAMFVYNIQELGSQLFQQLQMQYAQMGSPQGMNSMDPSQMGGYGMQSYKQSYPNHKDQNNDHYQDKEGTEGYGGQMGSMGTYGGMSHYQGGYHNYSGNQGGHQGSQNDFHNNS
jgi:hypothetical protein